MLFRSLINTSSATAAENKISFRKVLSTSTSNTPTDTSTPEAPELGKREGTVMGGIMGLMLGRLVSRATGLIFPSLPTAVPLWAAACGVLVSVGVGLFFRIWPAGRAARLDPVEALGYK